MFRFAAELNADDVAISRCLPRIFVLDSRQLRRLEAVCQIGEIYFGSTLVQVSHATCYDSGVSINQTLTPHCVAAIVLLRTIAEAIVVNRQVLACVPI